MPGNTKPAFRRFQREFSGGAAILDAGQLDINFAEFEGLETF